RWLAEFFFALGRVRRLGGALGGGLALGRVRLALGRVRRIDGAPGGCLALGRVRQIVIVCGLSEFIRGDEAVVIEIVLAELFQLLAGLAPFVERDLTILVRVEIVEPRGQVPRYHTVDAVKNSNGDRKGPGPEAALARRDDAVGSGLGRSIDDARQ